MGDQCDEHVYEGTNNIVAKDKCRVNTWGSNVINVLIMVLVTSQLKSQYMGLHYDECAYKGTNYIVTKDTCRVNSWGTMR